MRGCVADTIAFVAIILWVGCLAFLLARRLCKAIANSGFAAWFRNAQPPMRIMAVCAIVATTRLGGAKGTRGAAPPTAVLQVAETTPEPMLSVVSVRTNGVAFVAATSNAVEEVSWRAIGGTEMGAWVESPDGAPFFAIGTNKISRAYVSASGAVSFESMRRPPVGVTLPDGTGLPVLCPLRAPLGFVPEASSASGPQSRFWHELLPGGGVVLSWENALVGRLPNRQASVQAELRPSGDCVFRYRLHDALDPPATNFVIGAQTGANGVNALSVIGTNVLSATVWNVDGAPVTNGVLVADLLCANRAILAPSAFEIRWRNTTSLAPGADSDGDGLTDWQETFLHGTSPHRADTDGDGIADQAEVAGGSDPLDPDEDNDGAPDGWTVAQYQAHRLLNGLPSDRQATVSLLEETPPGNNAVLRIGDLPILLREPGSWTLSIPTGTVWDVELQTDGLPVRLALEAGPGIFAENADSVFASSQLADEQLANLRSAPPNPEPQSGGSNGGSAKLYAPCIFLDPVSQVVHCDETATVRARCVPDTPSLAGKLIWSFDPEEASSYFSVAQDTLSATVSGLGPDSPPTIRLHADVGYALTTGATVHYCAGHDNFPTNHVNFPPNHTNATINPVFRDCEHPFYDDEDDPKVFLEVEVGRNTSAGWQHLAWVDTDLETPGLQQRTAISRDNPPTVNWNAKATSSAPLVNGKDSLVYDNLTTFARALPAVAAGQYVPPPFATIISRTYDDHDNLINEFSTTLAIPQYVQITWTANALTEFQRPIVYKYVGASTLPPTNVTLFAGCTAAEATTVFSGIAAKVQTIFPPTANIIVVGPDVNVPQPHKTVEINSGLLYDPTTGSYSDALGATPQDSCHERNDSPSGMAYVFDGMIRQYLYNGFSSFYLDVNPDINNNWLNIPLPLSTDLLSKIFAQVAMHECCHAMGLVPSTSAAHNGHNVCTCGSHYMDRGKEKKVPMRLGFIIFYVQGWMPQNERYLRFVFPQNQ